MKTRILDRNLKKVSDLRKTINYMCRRLAEAKELIDDDPEAAKLILSETIGHPEYTYF